jgi:translation initiation factor 3 subunit A
VFPIDLVKTSYGNNADRDKMSALEQLHNVISNKRKGTWTKVHEDVMKRHIELCVDLKDHRLVKDGLHQYRNLCQNVRLCLTSFKLQLTVGFFGHLD